MSDSHDSRADFTAVIEFQNPKAGGGGIDHESVGLGEELDPGGRSCQDGHIATSDGKFLVDMPGANNFYLGESLDYLPKLRGVFQADLIQPETADLDRRMMEK